MKSLFWMKQVQASARVKIKEYVHAWSEFVFVSLLVIFIVFPQINYFYSFTSLHGLQDALTLEVSSGRLVEKFPISAFPMYYFLYNWIGEHEITKKKHLLRIQKNGHKKKHKKRCMNEMKRHKMDYLIFSAMRMRKRHLFWTSSHHNVPYAKQQELNKGSEPWNECSFSRARAQLLNMPYISTHLSVPHGENI